MPKARRTRRWSKSEDSTLWSALLKFGNENWDRVAMQMSGRSAEDCKGRWKQLWKVLPGGDAGKVEEAEERCPEDNLLLVPQPKSWDEMPLLPFMRICSFLGYREVFGVLPLVCKHFYQLLNENQVGLEEIELLVVDDRGRINKTNDVDVIEGLTKKVSTCRKLTVGEVGPDDAKALMEKLLDKFQRSVQSLRIQVDFSEQIYIPFVNNCRRLQYLCINDRRWDYSKLDVCQSVTTLHHELALHGKDLIIFEKFPNLKSLTVGWVKGNVERVNMESMQCSGRIEYLQVNRGWEDHDCTLLPLNLMVSLRVLKLNACTGYTLRVLLGYLPSMTHLSSLHLKFKASLARRDFLNLLSIENDLLRLGRVIPASLKEIEIEKLHGNFLFKFEDEFPCLLNALPKCVERILYNGSLVRERKK